MMNDQLERITTAVEQQCKLASNYSRTAPGRTNGEDFSDVVRAALNSKEFRGAVGTNAMLFMMISAILGKTVIDDIKKEDGLDRLATNESFNTGFMNMFWLGFQAGRQVEREEAQILQKLEK